MATPRDKILAILARRKTGNRQDSHDLQDYGKDEGALLFESC
jgi:hypothetical protein